MATYLRTLRAVVNVWVVLSMLLGGMLTPGAAAAPDESRSVTGEALASGIGRQSPASDFSRPSSVAASQLGGSQADERLNAPLAFWLQPIRDGDVPSLAANEGITANQDNPASAPAFTPRALPLSFTFNWHTPPLVATRTQKPLTMRSDTELNKASYSHKISDPNEKGTTLSFSVPSLAPLKETILFDFNDSPQGWIGLPGLDGCAPAEWSSVEGHWHGVTCSGIRGKIGYDVSYNIETLEFYFGSSGCGGACGHHVTVWVDNTTVYNESWARVFVKRKGAQ